MKVLLGILPLLLVGTHAQAAEAEPSRAPAIAARIADPDGGIISVAHRGCHNASPAEGRTAAPENSFAALDRCVVLGIDVVEVDVRRTRDGHLVMMHDDTVDRTTDGTGQLRTLTLDQVKALRLREGQGGSGASLTDQHVVTLKEMLEHAGERIMLLLDVKEQVFAEVLEIVRISGASGRVIIQPAAGAGSLSLANIEPYDQVPVMPALLSAEDRGSDLAQLILEQSSGATRPWAYSFPWRAHTPTISESALSQAAESARLVSTRLFANTMGRGTFVGYGGDAEALRDPGGVWGRLYQAGVSIFQTDEPEALAAFIASSADRSRFGR